ncbi:MAG TPA: hypothetical protein VMU02_00245 [bacterium]|nr:hypothetical protein [bacterium]
MTRYALLLAVLVLAGPGLASEPAGYQPVKIVDFPTAGLYEKSQYGVDMDLYADGGLLAKVGVGLTSFLNFGISYGGVGFIGSGDLDMNPRPEVNIRVRIHNENLTTPAIALGFDSQGHGRYMDKAERYLAKSRGFYGVASKNWELLGPFSLHGGLSYSLENKTDHDPTLFMGFTKSFAGLVELAGEYDFGINDNQGPASLTERHGFLNLSIGWRVREDLSLSLVVRDIATIQKVGVEDARKWNRGIGFSYRARL